MMQPDFHPAFRTDIRHIIMHIHDVTQDISAARRRAVEVDTLVDRILDNPFSGTRLDGALEGCLVRHGGRDHKVTIVFRPDGDRRLVRFLLASFGGQNWSATAEDRL